MADDVYLMLGPDGNVAPVDLGPMLARHRREIIRHRADAVDQAADLLLDESFDVAETWEVAAAAGMPPGMIDAAGNVALVLGQVEQLRQ